MSTLPVLRTLACMNRYMTLNQTSVFLSVSLRTVFRYLRNGRLTPVREGRRVYVAHEEACALRDAGRAETARRALERLPRRG